MGPTAVNQSDFATGVQQVADNIYSETTFVYVFLKCNHKERYTEANEF